MSAVELFLSEADDQLVFPEEVQTLSLASSPLMFFSDFLRDRPFVLDINTPALEAKRMMRASRVNMAVIFNRVNDFCGVLSLDDLGAQEFMKKQAEGQGREDITVKDFYHPKGTLFSVDYEGLSKSQISDVIHALRDRGQQYCLVVEQERHVVRGVLSADHIARKLNLGLNEARAANFFEIFKMVNAHHGKAAAYSL